MHRMSDAWWWDSGTGEESSNNWLPESKVLPTSKEIEDEENVKESGENSINGQENPALVVDEKPFKCHMCEAKFKFEIRLMNHVRVHTGEKPFKCEHCDLAYRSEEKLVEHTRVHTGETPYKCQQCIKEFRTKVKLKQHYATHSEELQFKCEECGEEFITKAWLRMHMRKHVSDKPFKCEQCDACFKTTQKRWKHRKSHAIKASDFKLKKAQEDAMRQPWEIGDWGKKEVQQDKDALLYPTLNEEFPGTTQTSYSWKFSYQGPCSTRNPGKVWESE